MADMRNLRVLEAAEDLTATVLAAVNAVQVQRAPGVRGQLVRAVSSVAANIAEAAGLGSQANCSRQLRLALASANESGTHLRALRAAGALDPISIMRCESKRTLVCKMLARLIERVDEQLARDEQQRRMVQ
jgi:four helix bundle protein